MSEMACPACAERDAIIAALRAHLAAVEARVRESESRLKTTASDSSLPPSANPIGAPAPVVKPKSGRKPGGQAGHPPRVHQLAPPERVTEYGLHIPAQCERCQADPEGCDAPADTLPVRHQVAELPVVRATVTEHQAHARTCKKCGGVTRATIPAAVRASIVGPNLTAVLGSLGGAHSVSRRGLQEVAAQVFDVPLSLGTIDALQMQISASLATAHAAALDAVRAAPVNHVDETGRKQAGRRRRMWMAATMTVAVFLIHPGRGADALEASPGASILGVLCTDRWSVSDRHPVSRRQVCWAHLERDFQKKVEEGGAGAAVGRAGLEAVEKLFEARHLFRGGGWDRNGLRERLEPVKAALRQALQDGAGCADVKVARFCRNLQTPETALWRFADLEGVEPTNTHAERRLRRAVIWRKNAFGSHSAAGCRLVERMLTVVQTLRLQKRQVLAFLSESLIAHREGGAAP